MVRDQKVGKHQYMVHCVRSNKWAIFIGLRRRNLKWAGTSVSINIDNTISIGVKGRDCRPNGTTAFIYAGSCTSWVACFRCLYPCNRTQYMHAAFLRVLGWDIKNKTESIYTRLRNPTIQAQSMSSIRTILYAVYVVKSNETTFKIKLRG
jgi:hypothetical protein